jgi:hypothetical protein
MLLPGTKLYYEKELHGYKEKIINDISYVDSSNYFSAEDLLEMEKIISNHRKR